MVPAPLLSGRLFAGLQIGYNGTVQEFTMKYRIYVEQDEDGKFVTHCPTLPGCWSQGDTRAEAIRNTNDAIRGYLESLRKHGDAIPPPITEEVIEVST